MIEAPVIPVGKDCDCGHPLIWKHDNQRCAVYGKHEPRQYVWVYRNMNAPLADVVDLFDGLDMPDCRRSRKADYQNRGAA